MGQTVFLKVEFFMLVATSVFLPCAIYGFLLLTRSISRWTVLALAVLLIALSAIDVILLQQLAGQSKATPSLMDDSIFATELSVTLYLLPAVFAGIGVNLISHVLTRHLDEAEQRFEREQSRVWRHQGRSKAGRSSEP